MGLTGSKTAFFRHKSVTLNRLEHALFSCTAFVWPDGPSLSANGHIFHSMYALVAWDRHILCIVAHYKAQGAVSALPVSTGQTLAFGLVPALLDIQHKTCVSTVSSHHIHSGFLLVSCPYREVYAQSLYIAVGFF